MEALEYIVDSDLPGVSGCPGVTVPARGQADYRLSMCPQFGGVFTGSLTFTAPGGVVTWYTVEVRRDSGTLPQKSLATTKKHLSR